MLGMLPALMHESFRRSLDDMQKHVEKNIPENRKKNPKQNKTSFPQVLAGICFAGHALMITL